MKQKLLVVLLALMVIFACSSCSVGEQEPSEPGDITGITLTEVGILSWNPYKGANSYRLVIGMNSMVYSEPSCNLNEFGLDDGDYTVGIFANKDESEFDLAFGELEFSYYDGVYSSAAGEPEPEPDPEDKLDRPALDIDKNIISWNRISGAIGYKLTINEVEHQLQTSETSYIIDNIEVGKYEVNLIALAEEEKNNSDIAKIEFTFDMFAAGNGTEEDPYEIVTGEHFSNISYFPEKNFRISEQHQLNGAQVQQIGNFSGTLDGDGQVISDLTATGDDMAAVPLFDTIEQGGTIQNLKLQISEVASDVIVTYNYGTLTGLTVAFDSTKFDSAKAEGYGYSLLAVANYGKISDSEVTGSATVPVYAVSGNQEKSSENSESIEGLIQNVTAEINIQIQADGMSSFGFSGIICQSNYGRIEDSCAKGLVEINCAAAGNSISGTGPVYIGGFAGDNRGIITRSESSVNLALYFSGLRYYKVAAGEFAGRNGSGGEITESRSAGSVSMRLLSGFNQMELGGFVGVNQGSLSSCSAEGTVSLSMESSSSPIDWPISSVYVGGLVGTNSQIGSSPASGTISDSFVRNAPATENFGGEDEGSGNIVGNVINDAICETSYAVDYKNIALSDKWLTFVDNAPALKVFAGDTPVITQKVTPVLDKGVVSWEAQSQAAYYLYKIDDGEAVRTENLFIDLNKLSLGQTGKYTLYIMVCNDDYAKGEWASIGFEVYSFTVMSEGSQAYEVFAVEGTEIQIRDYPVEKEGHTWVGLQDQDGNAYDINSKYVLIKSSTLSAQWSINQYKITFYTRTAQGEWKEISTEEKDYNTEIVFPTPKVEGWENSGYQFAGWYLDEFLSDSNNYTNIPAKHLELYAKFECKKFDLIAETNNGENAETAKVPYMTNVDESYLNSCFGNVKKFGYSFVGWFLDEKFETPFNPFKMGTSTVTIYAKWSLNTYSVTVETDGGDYEGEIPTSFTVEDGEIELPTAEKYGYTFHGWSVNGHESPISIFICNQYDENVVLKAMFVANKHEATFDYAEGHQQYKITFDSNGRNIHFNSVYVSESQLTVDLPEEKTINYIYNGWYYDSACTQPFKEGDIITADTTLYLDAYEVPAEIRSAYSKISANSALGALRSLTSSTFEGTSYSKSFKWLAVSEDITYGVNVSTWWRKTSSAPSLSVKLYVIDNGQKILSRTFSTKTGNIVDGSGTIGKSIRVSDSIHLEKGSIYLLEISATGSASYPLQEGSISIGSRALAIEDVNISFLGEKKSITFDEKLGALPTPQRFGYTFGGWLFNDEVVTSETVVKYDGNMPLKAKWIPIVAEVEYVLNDGINHQDNPNSYTIEDGNIRLLPAEKEGYRFMGWYLDEQFTTRISEFSYAEYQQGITLYARFEKLYTVTYVLPDYANTKEPDTRIETEKFYLDSLGDIIGGAQEYRFIGWYTDPEFLNPISFIEEGTQDCFVYAKFLPYYKVIVHLDGGTLQGQFAKFTQEDSFTFTDITATKANYYFDGWYSDKTYTQRLDGIEKGTMQNVDVYAKFVKCTDGLKFTLNSEKTGYIVSAENSMLGETDVTIPELYLGKPVVSVGSFENQTNITSVYIPDSVNSIADYAFRNCNGLQNFVIPETVDSIGEGIFSGCGNLNNLTIPFVGKTEQDEIPFGVLFGKQAFNGAVKIDQQHYENGEKVYAQYYVPISLNFITVNRGNISNYAFSNCENIQSVILGLNVSQIDEWAFYRCSSLEEVELANISIIGDNAFNGLSAIKQIDLPESLIAIGSGAFSGCSGLESIVFLKNLTSIGANAFARCQNLKTIEVPNNVTSIGNGAFSFCSNLTSITLPFVGENADGSGATHFGFIFGASTYNDNNKYVPTKLKNVIIENTTSISQYAFYQCNNITNLTLPFVGENADGSGATHFGFIFGASSYTGNYSLVPSSLDCVTITGGNKIAEKAFYACTNLTEIIFDKNVELTEIGINAFYACSSLISFEIPRGITELNSIFALCESLERVTFADGNQVTTIGDGAFAGLKNLTVIEIPSSVTTIGANAFGNCSQLSGVYISDIKAWCKIDFQGAYANPLSFGHNLYLNEVMLENLILPQDVETISKFAFFSCTSLKNLSLEANSKLTFIGNRAFSGCSNLTNVNLSSSNVEILEEGLFFDCVSLKTVVFGQNNQLKVFNQYLFSGCSNLLSVEIPDSVATIEDSVFSGCNSLQSLKIPAQVTSIKAAFYGCSGLESIIVADENTVYYSSNNCLIHVETKTLVLGCKNSIIPDDGSVTAIGDMAFISCSGLNNINIPDSITSIKARAFEGCTGLTNITFGENSKLSIIGDRAFYGCGKLTDIVIPVNVSSIGANAFKNCNILKNVYYGGADEQWSTISIDSSNSELKTANIYYYSFEQPTSAGNYWHYVEGIPTIWVTE